MLLTRSVSDVPNFGSLEDCSGFSIGFLRNDVEGFRSGRSDTAGKQEPSPALQLHESGLLNLTAGIAVRCRNITFLPKAVSMTHFMQVKSMEIRSPHVHD